MMVWHIFKKDWKLMGRTGAAIFALQLAYAYIQVKGEFGRGNPVLDEFHTLLMFLWLIASMIWVVLLVHQDVLPGTRQDWLTRPIRRIHVLIAKVLFAALVVQGSTIAGDLMQGLGGGFSFAQSLRAALVRALIGFIAITVPALLVGCLTQTIAEAMILCAVLGVGIFVFTLMAIALGGGYEHQFDPTNGSGVEWIPNTFRYLLVLAGGAVLMFLQYRSRKTARWRLASGGLLLLMLCSQTIPWNPVFALQARLSPQHGAANQITLAWHPHTQAGDAVSGDRFQYGMRVGNGASNDEVRLLAPIAITGLPSDSVLKEDNAAVLLMDQSGNPLHKVDGGSIEIWREGSPTTPVTYDQAAKIPVQFYQDNKDRSVRVQTTHSMTLFKLNASFSLSTMGGNRSMPGWGHCESKINAAGTAVQVLCMQIGKGPTCASVFLEDPSDGSRNQPNTACYPNYSPYIDRPIPDDVSHFRLVLPFSDPSGQLKYAVDKAKVENAQVVIRVYEPAEHFTRIVNSPLVPMRDLLAR